jgi:hypothetical protein
MDILTVAAVVILPSALAALWFAWQSGNFDFKRQR